VDQINRPGAFAGGEVEAPTGMIAGEMQHAGAFAARRPSGEVGATQGAAVGRRDRQCMEVIETLIYKNYIFYNFFLV
jgi:hypothetical protein